MAWQETRFSVLNRAALRSRPVGLYHLWYRLYTGSKVGCQRAAGPVTRIGVSSKTLFSDDFVNEFIVFSPRFVRLAAGFHSLSCTSCSYAAIASKAAMSEGGSYEALENALPFSFGHLQLLRAGERLPHERTQLYSNTYSQRAGAGCYEHCFTVDTNELSSGGNRASRSHVVLTLRLSSKRRLSV